MGGIIELPFPDFACGPRFTPEETDYLRKNYRAVVEAGLVGELAKAMGRTKSSLSAKAKTLGLTDRKVASRIASTAAKGVPKWQDKPHPRGFAGKRHSASVKSRCKQVSVDWWASLTPDEHDQRTADNLRAAIKKNGRIGPITSARATTWKAGWREVGGKRHYFRSRWEANYARYLEWLKGRGEIVDWEYESETFWFEGIKRGVRSYLPDFRVHELNGSKPLHEVKGWMCPRSKTTLKRMAKYHPSETIILIQQKEYRALERSVAPLIGDWE